MIQGTGSGVGKSTLVAAICRILAEDGWRVAPFKSQNMALNSAVTASGGEIGRAQAMQAEAAGIKPSVDMNPILLKPVSNIGSQVIVHGRPIGNMNAREYYAWQPQAIANIEASYARLASQFEVIVIEGAGSPAEPNLQECEVVNMRLAEMVDAPVILMGDIDCGGVFAALVGTLSLLSPSRRRRIRALHINKFRGDITLLEPGLEFLEQKTRKPLLGVTPYLGRIGLPEEDQLPEGKFSGPQPTHDNSPLTSHLAPLKIEVLALPHISNYTDFDPLEHEPGVELRYIRNGQGFTRPDLIIIPGTKNTLADLRYLWDYGYAQKIKDFRARGVPVLGICGGYQMLGQRVVDPHKIEAEGGTQRGLGLLPTETGFSPDKQTAQVEAECCLPFYQGPVKGYEIHMGKTYSLSEEQQPAFRIKRRSGLEADEPDGMVSDDVKVWGTYLHGLFDNDGFRRAYIERLRNDASATPRDVDVSASPEAETGLGVGDTVGAPFMGQAPDKPGNYRERREEAYRRLACSVRRSIDMELLYRIIGVCK